MTDSLRFKLTLSNLPSATRQKIRTPYKTAYDSVASESHTSHSTPLFIDGFYPKTKVKICVVLEENITNRQKLPVYLEAQVHVPNATCGHNVLHGTSVYAASIAALNVVRNGLAQNGVSHAELESLSIDDMELQDVTLTYLIPFDSPQKAHDAMEHFYQSGRTLLGKKFKGFESTNKTAYLSHNDFMVTAYVKTNYEHCKPDALTPLIKEYGDRIVRVEAKLMRAFLEKEGLTRVCAWQEAYADDRYRKLFNQTVRKILQLDTPLRSRLPKVAVTEKLDKTLQELLQRYFTGEALQISPSVRASKTSEQPFKGLAQELKKELNLDIFIPWKLHQTLKHAELGKWLIYPGDMNLEPDIAHGCFMKNSWGDLRTRLEQDAISWP